jgi:hypothetical protein
MSDPPPPPQVSPDGKFYWDGQRWVPMQGQPLQPSPSPLQVPENAPAPLQAPQAAPRRYVGCVTHTTCLTLVGIFVAVAVVLLIAGVCSSIASHQ